MSADAYSIFLIPYFFLRFNVTIAPLFAISLTSLNSLRCSQVQGKRCDNRRPINPLSLLNTIKGGKREGVL